MKLRDTFVERTRNLNRTEYDLLLYCIRRADQVTGSVTGVYYRDVMEETGMCKQSFYNSLSGLEEKGLIRAVRKHPVDYDIEVIGNSFPDENFRAYIKLNQKGFFSEEFHALKPAEKYLLFDFLKSTHNEKMSFDIKVSNLYEKYTKLLGVTVRTLRLYLHDLKQFFAIGIKNGKYWITYKKTAFGGGSTFDGYQTERAWQFGQLIRKECNRTHSGYDEQQIRDTAELISQYRSSVPDERTRISLVEQAIRQSVEPVKPALRKLNPAHIHKILIGLIDAVKEYVPAEEPKQQPRRNQQNRFFNFDQRPYDPDFYNRLENNLIKS